MDEYEILDLSKKKLAPIILMEFEKAGLTVSQAGAASHYLKEALDEAVAMSGGGSIFRLCKEVKG